VTIINESIISLLLRLHAKYSGRFDSYVPLDKRTGESAKDDYRQSRIGDACFYVEKILDRICEMDAACRACVDACRKQIWPQCHEQEARVQEEQEKREAEAKKKRARDRKRQMMEQLAAQRRRFMESNSMSAPTASPAASASANVADMDERPSSPSAGKTDSPSAMDESSAPEVKEYTCCHCLSTGPASEDRPIGLVALIQSSSVLAHRHHRDHRASDLSLPVSTEDEERLKAAFEGSLGAELSERFNEMRQLFGLRSTLLSLNNSWHGGIHIQSCGHHMHYDCRQSYCETLKQQARLAREQALDTDNGEFTCPMCRQMANALLPVPPEPPNVPATVFPTDPGERLELMGRQIAKILEEPTVHLSPGVTNLRTEMSHVMEFLTQATLPRYRMDRTNYPKHAIAMFIGSIARTNLESDLVLRGGTLVEPQGASAAGPSSGAGINKPKSCFIPLMHVLSIHMNLMQPASLSDIWRFLCGQACSQDGGNESSPGRAGHGGAPSSRVTQRAVTVAAGEAGVSNEDEDDVGAGSGLLHPRSLVHSLQEDLAEDEAVDAKGTGLRHVPMLVVDPVTLMINFILALPVNVEDGKNLFAYRECLAY